MKVEYDKEADAAYIYLKASIEDGEAKKTITAKDDIIFDLDEKGKILGIEILNASKNLDKEIIQLI